MPPHISAHSMHAPTRKNSKYSFNPSYNTVSHKTNTREHLPIVHLWRAHIALNLKFPLYPIYNNFQVQFTHTLDDGLTRLLVPAEVE